MTGLAFCLAALAAAYLYAYISAADQIRRKHGQPAYPQFEPRHPESLPVEVRRRFAGGVRALEGAGFVAVAYLYNEGLVRTHDRNAEAYFILFRNDETGDLAQLVDLSVQVKHIRSHAGYVAFVSEQPGGACVSTSNIPMLGVFRSDPARRHYRFAEIKDLRRLHRIHRAVAERDAPGRKGLMPSPGMEVPYLCEVESRSMRRQIEFGYFRVDASNTCWHTWKGALVMTGKLMYGIRGVRESLDRARSRATLRSLGAKAA